MTPDVTPPPERPLGKYFCGAGQDREGVEQAKALAKAAVSNKVKSSIEAELETLLEQQSKDDKVSVSSSYREQVKQSSTFEHAELIDVVEVQKFKRDWYAVACLQRKAAGHAVLDELRPTLQKHQRAHKRAQSALQNDDPSGFVVAYRTAKPLYLQAQGPGAILQVLVGKPSEFADFLDRHRALGDQAAELRESQTFAVRVDSTQDAKEVERAVGNAVQEALTALDLDAGRIGGKCVPGKTPAYLLDVEVDSNCFYGQLGQTCRPKMTLTATRCADREEVAGIAIESKKMQAVDSRSADRALQKTLARINGEALSPFIAEALASEVPLEE